MKISLPKNSQGFTLIEILVAIAIIGILTAITASSLGVISRNARNTQRNSDLRKIQNALEQFHADQGYYPATWTLGNNQFISLTNCTDPAAPAPCTVSRVYLSVVPHDPTDQYNSAGGPVATSNHYCYAATVSNGGAACSAASPSSCQYYGLYAELEDPSLPTVTCNGLARNLVVTP